MGEHYVIDWWWLIKTKLMTGPIMESSSIWSWSFLFSQCLKFIKTKWYIDKMDKLMSLLKELCRDDENVLWRTAGSITDWWPQLLGSEIHLQVWGKGSSSTGCSQPVMCGRRRQVFFFWKDMGFLIKLWPAMTWSLQPPLPSTPTLKLSHCLSL